MCIDADIYLLSFFQVFHFRVDQENRSQNLFPQDTLPQMFANIKSIYKFHADFLLPQVRIYCSSCVCVQTQLRHYVGQG